MYNKNIIYIKGHSTHVDNINGANNISKLYFYSHTHHD